MNYATYDSSIMQASADDLYKQANSIVRSTVLKYVVVTFFFGGFLLLIGAAAAKMNTSGSDFNGLILVLLIATVAAGFLGYSNGRIRAFHLRLEAQKILWHIQMEMNTRKTERATGTSA